MRSMFSTPVRPRKAVSNLDTLLARSRFGRDALGVVRRLSSSKRPARASLCHVVCRASAGLSLPSATPFVSRSFRSLAVFVFLRGSIREPKGLLIAKTGLLAGFVASAADKTPWIFGRRASLPVALPLRLVSRRPLVGFSFVRLTLLFIVTFIPDPALFMLTIPDLCPPQVCRPSAIYFYLLFSRPQGTAKVLSPRTPLSPCLTKTRNGGVLTSGGKNHLNYLTKTRGTPPGPRSRFLRESQQLTTNLGPQFPQIGRKRLTALSGRADSHPHSPRPLSLGLHRCQLLIAYPSCRPQVFIALPPCTPLVVDNVRD